MLTKIQLALSKIALHSPEFISLTSRLEFIANDSIPTAGTDGRRLMYNPAFLDKWTLGGVIGIICHEVGHCMLAHPARIGMRDKRLSNIAMDIVLNKTLQSYFEETKANLKAELTAEMTDLYAGNPALAKYDGWNWEKVYADMQENGIPKGLGTFDEVTAGTNEDGTPMNAAQADALAREWTMAAQQAATMAKARGLGSAMFESFVSGLVKTKVDWRSYVLDVATKAAKDDQSWRRFNRKMIHAETYLPSMYSERIGSVGFFVDTSGSMDDENFKIALGGMNEILELLKPDKIVFGCCDTEMKSIEELTPDDLPVVAKSFKGRGGTVLTPIFEYVSRLDEPLELVVLLTDGQCDVIPKSLEPACPVVWLVTTDSVAAPTESFGQVLRVEG